VIPWKFQAAVLTVNEIFHSIQGESTYAGTPCVFVRLTACDLRCSWCDTPYAFHEGRKMSIDQVLSAVEDYRCPVVEITGGEPLLQADVYPLMSRLLERGKTVRIVDVKCPGSGEAAKMDWANLQRVTDADQVKFVIKDRIDYEYAREIVTRESLAGRVKAVLFSPVHGVMDARLLAEWILADRLAVRLQLQAHKFIWPPDTRGV
jgi:7-carboxy-7-deazaguanine synthase